MADSPSILESAFQNPTVRRFSLSGTERPERTPCFSVYLLERGRGKVQVDYATHDYSSPALLCLSTYQRATFSPTSKTSGWLLQFHANFFCIETHHHAVGCNGVLFNEVYEVPLVHLESGPLLEFSQLMQQMHGELEQRELAHMEILISTLKILLIKATRLKLAQQGTNGLTATKQPEALRRLRELVEENFQKLHRPSDYAQLLGTSPKTLAQLVRTHLHKTLSELIRDRIIKHAKWQLLHTRKSVKEIAYEVGFDDEFYFSRLFKLTHGCAPLVFREQETEWRGGSNMSM